MFRNRNSRFCGFVLDACVVIGNVALTLAMYHISLSLTFGQGIEDTVEMAKHADDLADELKQMYLDRDLSFVITARSHTLAINAYFFEVFSSVPADSSLSEGEGRIATERFFGFCEGRLGVRIPLEFQEDFRDSTWSLGTTVFPNLLKHQPKQVQEVIGLHTFGKVLVERDETDFIVSHGNDDVQLPEEVRKIVQSMLDVGYTPEVAIGVEFTSDLAVIFVYESIKSHSQQLWLVDKKEGSVNWTSKIWGGVGRIGSSSGPSSWTHFMHVKISDSKVHVFGRCMDGFYIETFDLRTGKPLLRFASTYFPIVQHNR